MGRPKTGVEDSPRNRIIFGLRDKGFSMNGIVRELSKKGFFMSPQRVSDILKNPPIKN